MSISLTLLLMTLFLFLPWAVFERAVHSYSRPGLQVVSNATNQPAYQMLLIVLFEVVVFVYYFIVNRLRPTAANATATVLLFFTIFVGLIPLFAIRYIFLSYLGDFQSGGQPVKLTGTDAVYFTMTTFTTEGFGDFVPSAEASRLLVTVQLFVVLVLHPVSPSGVPSRRWDR